MVNGHSFKLVKHLTATAQSVITSSQKELKGSVKELNILIYFFFHPSFNRVVSDFLFTGGKGVLDFSVLKYY